MSGSTVRSIWQVALSPADCRLTRFVALSTRREIAGWCLGSVVLVVLDVFLLTVGWWIYAGMVCGLVAWEVTKFRLRRNADHFAGHR
jgi:hypothetical protein